MSAIAGYSGRAGPRQRRAGDPHAPRRVGGPARGAGAGARTGRPRQSTSFARTNRTFYAGFTRRGGPNGPPSKDDWPRGGQLIETGDWNPDRSSCSDRGALGARYTSGTRLSDGDGELRRPAALGGPGPPPAAAPPRQTPGNTPMPQASPTPPVAGQPPRAAGCTETVQKNPQVKCCCGLPSLTCRDAWGGCRPCSNLRITIGYTVRCGQLQGVGGAAIATALLLRTRREQLGQGGWQSRQPTMRLRGGRWKTTELAKQYHQRDGNAQNHAQHKRVARERTCLVPAAASAGCLGAARQGCRGRPGPTAAHQGGARSAQAYVQVLSSGVRRGGAASARRNAARASKARPMGVCRVCKPPLGVPREALPPSLSYAAERGAQLPQLAREQSRR